MYIFIFFFEGCILYIRLGGVFELLLVLIVIYRGMYYGGVDLGGIGFGDVVWKYFLVNYLVEDRVWFLNYFVKYLEYNFIVFLILL